MPKKMNTRQTKTNTPALTKESRPSQVQPRLPGNLLPQPGVPDLPMVTTDPSAQDVVLMEKLVEMRTAAGLPPATEEDRMAVIRGRQPDTSCPTTSTIPVSPRKRPAAQEELISPRGTAPCPAAATRSNKGGRSLEPDSRTEVRKLTLDKDDLYALVPLRYSGVNPSRPKMTPREFNKYRFGDHSLVATGIAPDLLLNLPSEIGSPTMLRAASKSSDNWYRYISSHGGGIYLTSFFTTTTTSGGFGPTTPITTLALSSFPPATDLNAVNPLSLSLGPPIQVGEVNTTALMQFYQSGLPSSKLITSALEPVLRPANNQICRYISNDFALGQRYYDNSTLYAKLVYLALVKDIADSMSTALSAQPYKPNDFPNFVNLADPALQGSVIDNAIGSGQIVLLDGLDWDVHDLDIIFALASSGQRYWVVGDNAAPHGAAVTWPRVPISIWYHQATPPPTPAPAVLESSRVIDFAFRLATARAEVSSLLKGFYVATEVLGVWFSKLAQPSQSQWWPLTCQYHTNGGLRLPNMFDYNVLHRALGILPQCHLDHQEEIFTLPSLDLETRVTAVSLYVSAMRAFTTTLLQDLSIITQDIINWCLALPARGKVNTLFHQGLSRSIIGYRREALGFSAPRLGYKHYFGFEIYHNLYPSQSWNPICALAPDSVLGCTAALNPLLPPLLVSQLGIDFALLARPVEWGIVGPEPSVSLNMEVVLATTPDKRGWYSNMGTRAFTANDTSGRYYEYVFYAAQIMNVISQFYAWDQMTYHVSRHVSSPSAIDWSCLMPAAPPPFNAQLHILEPGQLVTFDWASTESVAPALVGTDLTDAIATQLSMWCNNTIKGVGYSLETALSQTANIALPALFLAGGPTLSHRGDDPTLDCTLGAAPAPSAMEGVAPSEEPNPQLPPGNCQNIQG